MKQDECLKLFGLTPTLESASEIRSLLVAEMDLETKSQGDGDQELIKLNCVQLFALGDLGDSVLIWRAKQCSFDMSCSIDVQLLCGASERSASGNAATHECVSDRARKKELD